MKKPFAKSVTLITALALAVGTALAGSSQGPVVHTLVTNPTNDPSAAVFIFKNAATITGTPTCNSGNQAYAVRLSTPAGKAIQQQVQLAVALGKEIYVYGDNTCSAWGDRETPSYVQISY